MSSEWCTSNLLDHYDIRSGLSKPAKDFGSGYPFLTFKDVFYNYFTPEALGDSVQSTEKERENCSVFRGDVFLTRTSETMHELGMSCVALKDYENATFNGFCKRLRPKPDCALIPEYVGYYLRSPKFRQAMVAFSTMSTRASLNNEMIGRLEISYPSKEVQTQIAEVLKSLDDRITLLRETNATLEAIAQALFKSWFVDFDPVRAKQEGRAPEGMDEATATLFPDGFEESELGLLPRGWRAGTIEQLCQTITNGGTPSRSKKEFWDDGTIPWFKTGDFSDGFLLAPAERISDFALKTSAAKLLPEHAILMAIYAAPTVGRLGVLTEPATFNQACTGMVAKENVGPWFLYWALYFGRAWFNSRANGAAQQNISKAIVASYKSVIPPDNILRAFNNVAGELHARVRLNSEKSLTLATLRDTLLPRLISGQLRLPEAEALAA